MFLTSFYCEKIEKGKKEDMLLLIKDLNFFLSENDENEKIKIDVLFRLTKKLFELKSNELVIHIIDSLEKLKYFISFLPKDTDFLIYIYVSSLIKNGRYSEIVINKELFLKIDEKSNFYEATIFNIAMSLRKVEKIKEAINILKNVDSYRCKTELALNYSLLNDKKELEIYNSLLNKALSFDEKVEIFLGYSNFFIKNGYIEDCKKYLNKSIETMQYASKEYRSIRYYEIAIIFKKLNELEDSVYFFKRSAESEIFGETEFEYKIKSAIMLKDLGYYSVIDISSLIKKETVFKESELIINKIKELEEVLSNEKNS